MISHRSCQFERFSENGKIALGKQSNTLAESANHAEREYVKKRLKIIEYDNTNIKESACVSKAARTGSVVPPISGPGCFHADLETYVEHLYPI